MRCALLWRKFKDSAIWSKPCFISSSPISCEMQVKNKLMRAEKRLRKLQASHDWGSNRIENHAYDTYENRSRFSKINLLEILKSLDIWTHNLSTELLHLQMTTLQTKYLVLQEDRTNSQTIFFFFLETISLIIEIYKRNLICTMFTKELPNLPGGRYNYRK